MIHRFSIDCTQSDLQSSIDFISPFLIPRRYSNSKYILHTIAPGTTLYALSPIIYHYSSSIEDERCGENKRFTSPVGCRLLHADAKQTQTLDEFVKYRSMYAIATFLLFISNPRITGRCWRTPGDLSPMLGSIRSAISLWIFHFLCRARLKSSCTLSIASNGKRIKKYNWFCYPRYESSVAPIPCDSCFFLIRSRV